MELTIPLRVNVSSANITSSNKDALGTVTTELYCYPTNIEDFTFLKFPFNDTARQLNSATTGLILFDNPLFKFIDKEDEMREVPNEATMKKFELDTIKAFQNVLVSGATYSKLKVDVEKRHTRNG